MRILLLVVLFGSGLLAQARPFTIRKDDAHDFMEALMNVGFTVQDAPGGIRRVDSRGELYCLYGSKSPEGLYSNVLCYTSNSYTAPITNIAGLALFQKVRRFGTPYTNIGYPGFDIKYGVICDFNPVLKTYACVIRP